MVLQAAPAGELRDRQRRRVLFMNTDVLRRVWGMFIVLAVAGFGVAGPPQEPKEGLRVGDQVPISSMRCVVGEPKDRNTCLAGKYRAHRTFSTYARSLEEPRLNALLKKVDGLLAHNKELRGYVLLLEGDQDDQALKGKLRDWAKQQQFTKLDVAIANDVETFGIAKETGVVVVYSENLQVKYHRAFAGGKIDETALKELAGKLEDLSR
jgi:hypothetical protein